MPTINDVARHAGLSVATVSRVINGMDGVRQKNVEVVNRAIDALGYRPNVMGRNLRMLKSNRIIVLQPSISNPFFSRVVRGIEYAARKAGYQIMLCDTDNDPEREAMYLGLLDSHVADGAILITSCADPCSYQEVASRHALIHCCEYYDDHVLSSVTMDNALEAYDAVKYLIDLGHRRIGFFSVYNKYLTVKQRYEGYKLALSEAGIEHDEALCIGEGPIIDDAIWEATLRNASRFAQLDQPPTAIFCSSDMVAIATIRALKAKGLRVPEDISIVSFDDIDVARLFIPSLTTVHVPKRAIGEEAVKLLLGRINNPRAEVQRVIMPCMLITRDSTASLIK